MEQTSKPNRFIPGFLTASVASANSGLPSADSTPSCLEVPRNLFFKTMGALEKRSDGLRESAGVWAGQVIGELRWQPKRLYLHHKLYADRAGPLSLELTEAAKLQLYEQLARQHLRLVALIHTHPQAWVDLSEIDRANQLSSRVGFWSIVVPWYSSRPWRVDAIGFHVRTETGWHRLTASEVKWRVSILE